MRELAPQLMAREYFERKKKIIEEFEKKYQDLKEQFRKDEPKPEDINKQKQEMESILMNLRFEVTDDSKSELVDP